MALVSCGACGYEPLDTTAHHCVRCGCTSPFVCAICGNSIGRLQVRVDEGRLLCESDYYRTRPRTCRKCQRVVPDGELGEVVVGWTPQWSDDRFAGYWPVRESGWCGECRSRHEAPPQPDPPDPRTRPPRTASSSSTRAEPPGCTCGIGVLALLTGAVVLALLAPLFLQFGPWAAR